MRMQSMLLVLAVCATPVVAQTRVTSPDNRNEVQVGIHEGGLYYIVNRDGTTLLTPSRLGFVFRGQPRLRDSLAIADSSRSTFDETWTQPWGEVRRVRNHYNELKISVQENTGPRRQFTLAVRAFNDGIAFRYEFPAQPSLGEFEIMDELTEFAFADNARASTAPSSSTRRSPSVRSTACRPRSPWRRATARPSWCCTRQTSSTTRA